MNANWLGIGCGAGALVVFFLVHRLSATLRKGTQVGLAIASTVLAIPAASFALYYAHVLPEPAWYYEFRSWQGTECLLVTLGLPGGFFAALLPRRSLIIPLFGTAAFALAPNLKPLIGPLATASLKDSWDNGICLQSTESTCGPSSVATLLAQCGLRVSETALAREAHTYVGGTEGWYLARTVRARGLSADFQVASGFDPSVVLPAVAGVQIESTGHFIPILSREGDRFTIGDPMKGREDLSLQELMERYTFTGFYLSIGKSPAGSSRQTGSRLGSRTE